MSDKTLPCFSWCRHGDDAIPGNHDGASVRLELPAEVNNGAPLHLLSTTLWRDDDFDRSAVCIEPPDADGANLDSEEAEAFADSLIAFAAQIRQMARRAAERRAGYDTEAADR